MSTLGRKAIVVALAERLKQIKKANGYQHDLLDKNVFVSRRDLDPTTDLEPSENVLATVVSPNGRYPSNGNRVTDFDKVADFHLICGVRPGFEHAVDLESMIDDVYRAALTPVGGNDVLSQNLNSLIPQEDTTRYAEHGEAWTQITFIVTARWCDDLEAGDD